MLSNQNELYMDKIQRTQHYYQLVIDKFTASGRSPHQLQVHKELLELVKTCSSYEEIQSKMKSQGFYEKPAQALFMDKMASLRDAALVNGFNEVAETYDQKYKEVAADYSQAYATGYEQEVARKLNKIGNIVGAVNALFQLYLQFLSRYDYEDPMEYVTKVRNLANEIHGNGSELADALNDSYNREHVELNDQAYQEFVRCIIELNTGNIGHHFDPKGCDEEFNELWPKLKEQKDKIKEIGKAEEARSKRKVYMAIPPDEEGGEYLYVEPREEGR